MRLGCPNKIKSKRKLARLAGNLTYTTGVTCPNGHNTFRFVSNGSCSACLKLTKDRYNNSAKGRAVNSAYYHANKARYKGRELWYVYGLTLDDWASMLAAQNGQCRICLKQLTLNGDRYIDRPHVDHCHETGKVRGLLCRECNLGIGHLRHHPDSLRRAAEYCSQ